MKLELELRQEVRDFLAAKAAAEGKPMHQVIEGMLEVFAVVGRDISSIDSPPEKRAQAMAEFLAGMETDAGLPEVAFKRQNWYPDGG